MSLASNLNLDLRWLHPTAWVYWQVLDGGGWGLVSVVFGRVGHESSHESANRPFVGEIERLESSQGGFYSLERLQ